MCVCVSVHTWVKVLDCLTAPRGMKEKSETKFNIRENVTIKRCCRCKMHNAAVRITQQYCFTENLENVIHSKIMSKIAYISNIYKLVVTQLFITIIKYWQCNESAYLASTYTDVVTSPTCMQEQCTACDFLTTTMSLGDTRFSLTL